MPTKHFANPSDPNSPFIYGETVRMLKQGGPWREGEPEPFHFDQYRPVEPDKANKIRTKARTVEFYPGEFATEPDPKVSNVKWTGTIIRHMVLQGFTPDQIAEQLRNPAHVGGAFYRFIALVDETFLSRYIEGSDPSTSLPSNTTPRGSVLEGRSGWKQVGTFKVQKQNAQRLLTFLKQQNDGITVSALKRAAPIHPRTVESVLRALEDTGLITRTEGTVQTAAGRRKAKVIRVADAETVALHLSADNLPEEDRSLWDSLDTTLADVIELPMRNLFEGMPTSHAEEMQQALALLREERELSAWDLRQLYS